REMTNTTLRAARSGIINLARDFSCSIVTGDGRLLFVMEGLPVHLANSDMTVQGTLALFKKEEIKEGDAYLNNSPFHGNTHPADHTIMTPVFFEGELMFITMVRGHQADIGNSEPTTYMAYPKDVYEEGAIYWPGVRVQRDYKDIEDVLRIGKIRIRVPDQWFGDYLAMVGACRIGERRLKEFCAKHGREYVKAFIEAYMEYGEVRIVEEIKKLKKAHLEYETRYDPVPGVADEGIPVRIKADVDPEAGNIYIDVTDNVDSVKGGLNLCAATTRASATIGVLCNLDPDIPHNDGTFKHLPVKMKEGKVIGYTANPGCMSVATNSVAERLANASGAMFASMGPEYGVAEHGSGLPVGLAVISGHDWRRQGNPYCNEVIAACGGGGALYGYDGWLTIEQPVCMGTICCDSIEIDEQKYPILVKCRSIVPDTCGHGRWRGASGRLVEFIQRGAPGEWAYINDGHFNPFRGIQGGLPAAPTDAWKYKISHPSKMWAEDAGRLARREDLPQMAVVTLQPETEVIVSDNPGGGGFGDPLERDPELVRYDAREEYVSLAAARDVYGVVLNTEPELYEVDYEATEKLRQELKK
ncbi:MAG: hydantoinase B/oxoprolinase family protein, partial [Pseudomonadota bacterium]